MAKSIEGIIEDRIDDGMGAWRMKLKLARTSRFPEVVDLAVDADTKLSRAKECLDEVQRKQDQLGAEAATEGTDADHRQMSLEDEGDEPTDEGLE